jgi:hypothetical protein
MYMSVYTGVVNIRVFFFLITFRSQKVRTTQEKQVTEVSLSSVISQVKNFRCIS